MRLIRGLVILLALAGTGALLLASRAQARPVTVISAIAPSMNFAYVRVEGVMPAYPTLAPEGDYLSFRVRDASGEMRVFAYRAVAQRLLALGRVPMPGDEVTVEGTLRVRDDEPSLTLNAAEGLTVVKSEALAIDLPALQALRVGERAITTAQVRRVRDAGGLRIVTLRKGNAEADMTLPTQLPSVFGEPPMLAPGDWISVTAGVTEFRANKQLAPAKAADVVRASPAMREDIRPVAALGRQLLGQWVTLRGAVREVRATRTVTRITVGDDSGEMTLVMFEAWHSVPFSQTLRAGDVLLVSGALTEFRGQFEVQPELAFDLVKE